MIDNKEMARRSDLGVGEVFATFGHSGTEPVKQRLASPPVHAVMSTARNQDMCTATQPSGLPLSDRFGFRRVAAVRGRPQSDVRQA